jgi:hypothetical protein
LTDFKGLTGLTSSPPFSAWAFVQNKNEIAEDLIAAGTLVEFKPGDRLTVQNDGTNDAYLLAAGTVQVTQTVSRPGLLVRTPMSVKCLRFIRPTHVPRR